MPDSFDPTLDANAADMQDAIDEIHQAVGEVAEATAVLPDGPEKVKMGTHFARVDAWHLRYENTIPKQERTRRDRRDLLAKLAVWEAQLTGGRISPGDQQSMRQDIANVLADVEQETRP